MRTIHETIHTLEEFYKWRRGDETFIMPEPFELGVAIGDALRLLREHAAMKARAEKAEAEVENLKTDLFLALRQINIPAGFWGRAASRYKARAKKAEAEVERLTKHCSALEVEVAVLSEGLSEDHAIYIANARAEKAESSLHDLSLDLSTANHMIKLERDRADALQTRLNELDSILKKHNLID